MSERSSSRLERLLPLVTVALGAGGLVAAIGFYFGRVYLIEQYREYGASIEQVGYDRTDIAVRSIGVFLPVAFRWILALTAVLLLTALWVIASTFLRRRWPQRFGTPRVLAVVGLLVVAGGVLVLATRPDWSRLEQGAHSERWLLLLSIVCLLAWELTDLGVPWLAQTLDLREEESRLRWTSYSVRFSVVLLFVAGLVYTANSVATDAGVRAACTNEQNYHNFGLVTLHATQRLGISHRSLNVTHDRFIEIDDVDGRPDDLRQPYALELPEVEFYEYGGLRILTEANGVLWVFGGNATPRRGIVAVDTSLIAVASVTEDRSAASDIPLRGACARLLGNGT